MLIAGDDEVSAILIAQVYQHVWKGNFKSKDKQPIDLEETGGNQSMPACTIIFLTLRGRFKET